MATTYLTDMRAKVRLLLEDASTTWSNDQLNQAILQALNDLDSYSPREVKDTTHCVTVASSRDIDISTLVTDNLITVRRVEYPTAQEPPTYPPFEVWGSTLTLLVTEVNIPAASSEAVYVWYVGKHTLSESTKTYRPAYEESVALGASAYALLNRSTYSIRSANIGGEQSYSRYATEGVRRLMQFHAELRRLSMSGRLRVRAHRERAVNVEDVY